MFLSCLIFSHSRIFSLREEKKLKLLCYYNWRLDASTNHSQWRKAGEADDDQIVLVVTSADDDIDEVSRIGRGGRNPRIVKVKFSSQDCRINILRNSRHLNSDKIRTSFGRIFVSKDQSFLRRMEEKRLRNCYKEVKNRNPQADVKLRNGKLFIGNIVRDCIDFQHQLF